MYVTISVLILNVRFLMMLVVLVQNSKGGGLASNFSSHNQILGVRKTTDFLEKTTWTLAVLLVVLFLASSVAVTHRSAAGNIRNTQIEVPIQNPLPIQGAEVAE